MEAPATTGRPWRVWFTSRDAGTLSGYPIESWLDARVIPDGTPFLIDPDGSYDAELNAYFSTLPFVAFARDTQEAVARDMARFFTFLSWSRGTDAVGAASSSVWRDASETDRAAYYQWRNVDLSGPRVAASTWNREVATVSGFYQWAIERGLMEASPIRLREGRKGRGSVSHGRTGRRADAPAEVRPDSAPRSVTWLPAEEYRKWRDVALRGYLCDGLRDRTFRGTLSGRNAVFADLMMRTGLRLTEQSSLLVDEIPMRTPGKRFRKFWLKESVAKNGSARDVYVPDQVLGALEAYKTERAGFVEAAQKNGTYDGLKNILLADGRGRFAADDRGQRHEIASLTAPERRRLFRSTSDGLEPLMMWVSERGVPLSSNSWQNVFQAGNQRCSRIGLDLRCHPHALRHTYAVRTLEQLQRGHLEALGRQNPDQRRHYAMVFGDPLNWVRIRLGHRSIETTMIYLHTLAELEYETRMVLVGFDDEWDIPDEEAGAG